MLILFVNSVIGATVLYLHELILLVTQYFYIFSSFLLLLLFFYYLLVSIKICERLYFDILNLTLICFLAL